MSIGERDRLVLSHDMHHEHIHNAELLGSCHTHVIWKLLDSWSTYMHNHEPVLPARVHMYRGSCQTAGVHAYKIMSSKLSVGSKGHPQKATESPPRYE